MPERYQVLEETNDACGFPQSSSSPKQDFNHRLCPPCPKAGLEPQEATASRAVTSSISVSDSLLPTPFCPPFCGLYLNHLCPKIMGLPVSGESMPVSLPWEPSPFLSEPSLPFQLLPPTTLLWAQWAQLSVLELVLGFLDPLFQLPISGHASICYVHQTSITAAKARCNVTKIMAPFLGLLTPSLLVDY